MMKKGKKLLISLLLLIFAFPSVSFGEEMKEAESQKFDYRDELKKPKKLNDIKKKMKNYEVSESNIDKVLNKIKNKKLPDSMIKKLERHITK